jgi:hypothetical protein
LEVVLAGDETSVGAAAFEQALWVHCRRKVREGAACLPLSGGLSKNYIMLKGGVCEVRPVDLV